MIEFLVEAYVSRSDAPADERKFSELLPAIRFVRSIYVPEDETCFYLFQAASIDDVREAAVRAGLRVERITEALSAG